MDQVAKWQQVPFDKETQENVNALLSNPKALEDAFYTDLSFGTGGMRGIMGVGTNRVNRYTFGRNTPGLCNYIKTSLLICDIHKDLESDIDEAICNECQAMLEKGPGSVY